MMDNNIKERDIVKEIKVNNILGKMLETNKKLYEQILDSDISSLFNEICNIAMSNHIQFKSQNKNIMQSVLQDWVMQLPLRKQGTLLTAVRGCDSEPKQWTSTGVSYSPGRRLTAFIRWCFMNPADIREVDSEEGAFMMSTPPTPFKPSEFGHLPQHWYSHAMHALEVIGYHHPNEFVAQRAGIMYFKMVKNMHLNPEEIDEFTERLTEDRIANKTVVS